MARIKGSKNRSIERRILDEILNLKKLLKKTEDKVESLTYKV